MGEQVIYTCEGCGFEINENFPLFYYDSDSESVVEYILLMSTAGIDRFSKIKGNIIETYCPHCNKFLKTYLINEITCSNYDSKEILRIIKKGIDNRLNNLKVETKHQINELNQIKDEKNCVVEQEDDYWNFYFPDVDDCDYYFKSEDFSSEKEMYETAYNSFNDYVDSEISRELDQCQFNHDAIYNVIDVSTEDLKKEFNNLKYISCPICNNDTFGFDEISCPKCGGDFLSVVMLID